MEGSHSDGIGDLWRNNETAPLSQRIWWSHKMGNTGNLVHESVTWYGLPTRPEMLRLSNTSLDTCFTRIFLDYSKQAVKPHTKVTWLTPGSSPLDSKPSSSTYHSTSPWPTCLPSSIPLSAPPLCLQTTNCLFFLNHQTEQQHAIYSPSLTGNFALYSKTFPQYLLFIYHFSNIFCFPSVFPISTVSWDFSQDKKLPNMHHYFNKHFYKLLVSWVVYCMWLRSLNKNMT